MLFDFGLLCYLRGLHTFALFGLLVCDCGFGFWLFDLLGLLFVTGFCV